MSRHVLARLAAGGTWTSPVAPTSTLRSLRHVALPALPKSRPGILPRDPRLHARPPPQDSWTLRGSASDQVDWSWPGAFEAHRVYRCGSDASACTECGCIDVVVDAGIVRSRCDAFCTLPHKCATDCHQPIDGHRLPPEAWLELLAHHRCSPCVRYRTETRRPCAHPARRAIEGTRPIERCDARRRS